LSRGKQWESVFHSLGLTLGSAPWFFLSGESATRPPEGGEHTRPRALLPQPLIASQRRFGAEETAPAGVPGQALASGRVQHSGRSYRSAHRIEGSFPNGALTARRPHLVPSPLQRIALLGLLWIGSRFAAPVASSRPRGKMVLADPSGNTGQGVDPLCEYSGASNPECAMKVMSGLEPSPADGRAGHNRPIAGLPVSI